MSAETGVLISVIGVAALYIVQAFLFYRAGWHHGRASGITWCDGALKQSRNLKQPD